MESISLLKKPPDKETIEEIAIELAVHPSFIEKDWYAVRTLEIVSKVSGKCEPIFSGGTSLSKGYGLIERFSEDLDFKIDHPDDAGRNDFRDLREGIYKKIDENPYGMKIIDGTKFSLNSSRFFGCSIDYPRLFAPTGSIRPHVKLEFSARKPYMSAETRDIRSFATQLQKGDPDFTVKCIRPIETAADKLSAFIWRVLNRDRSHAKDDPALIRHLHDLAKLMPIVLENAKEFWAIAEKAYAEDVKERSGVKMPASLVEAFGALIAALKKDALYKDEYIKFVSGVSYEDASKQIDYEAALKLLTEIKDSRK